MTSGNGSTNSSQHNGESKAAQQAIDKSRILTHLIEGFVIQEGAEPFPVEHPSFSIESFRRRAADSKMDGLSSKDLKAQQEPMLTCELCGKVDFAYIFKRSKRFCSTVCAKRYNVGCTKRMGLFPNRKTSLQNLKKRTLNGSYKNTSLESKNKVPAVQASNPPLLPDSFLPSDPGQWNIQEVYEFISSLPGCLEIAEEFRSQEIDGQALLLLKEDHLMGTMNIKLGPALKIFAQISVLKDS
ncbi:polyhomeotic-like protein 2 isoform 2-T4 [Fundulus diaphanus]